MPVLQTLNSTIQQEFLSRAATIATADEDFSWWHKGRSRYYCWVIAVEHPKIISRLAQASVLLADWLRQDYFRQPHITLAVCGFWTESEPRHNDDFTAAMLQRQLHNLQSCAIAPFELKVGGLNSFASAPFLEVIDSDGALKQLRRTLSVGDEFRTTPYCPHVTVGLYRDSFQSDKIASEFIGFKRAPISFRVTTISLISYDSSDVGSILRLERQHHLTSKAFDSESI